METTTSRNGTENRNGTYQDGAHSQEEAAPAPQTYHEIGASPPVSHPTILPHEARMPATQNRTLLGEELSSLLHQGGQPSGGQASDVQASDVQASDVQASDVQASDVQGQASAAPSGVSLRVEQTPAEFGHLYAALERQAPGLGEVLGAGADALGTTSPYVLGVTSAVGGEGKTTVALHLAMTIARDTFKKVCLLDMSLGGSDLAARLGMPASEEGVVSVLEASGTVVPTLQLTGCDNLVIIPAGRTPANAARLARSPRVEQLLVSARYAFDVVVVDLPSVSTDNAGPLAKAMDGVLVVVRAGVTPQAIVSRALDLLGRDKVLGVTLNRVPAPRPRWGRAK